MNIKQGEKFPHNFSNHPVSQVYKIWFFKDASLHTSFLFGDHRTLLHTTKTSLLNKMKLFFFFLPVFSPTNSQGKSHLYLQPFKFRQVAKSLCLQGFQVVEVQVAVTQKSTRDRVKDHNLKDNHSPHISVFSLLSSIFTCKNSSQHWLLPVLSIVYSLWINCNTHWGDQICSSLKLWKNETHEEPAAAVPHPTTIQELSLPCS